MATSNNKARPSASQAGRARLKRQMTGLSLGMLLASFAAVVAAGVPTQTPDLLGDIIDGPRAAGATQSTVSQATAVPSMATDTRQPSVSPPRGVAGQQQPVPARRPRTRMS